VVRIAKLILALLVLAPVLAACGTEHWTASPAASAPATASPVSTTSAGPTVWRTFPADQFTSMHLADSGRVLVIPVQVPPETSACLRDFTARLTAFSSARASLTITFEEPTGPAAPPCPLGPIKTVRITLAAPLGSRQVSVDAGLETFWSTGPSTLTLCATFGGTCKHVPTEPPPATCSDASYSWAMGATGPPQGAASDPVGCDGHWLVLDVGWSGGPSGCDGPSCGQNMAVTHWFFRASAHGWIVITSSLTAGCTRVHQVAPQFPTALCARLPAVGPDASTS
jgi:hypothetical protein